jgi:hypothetical protein
MKEMLPNNEDKLGQFTLQFLGTFSSRGTAFKNKAWRVTKNLRLWLYKIILLDNNAFLYLVSVGST